MEYFGAILIFIGMVVLTTFVSAFLGFVIPISYSILGFILGTRFLILGLGGLFASIVNLISASIYLKNEGAMSIGPIITKKASLGYIISFIAVVSAKHIFNFDLSGVNPAPINSKEEGILRYKKKWGGNQVDLLTIRT